MPLHRSQDSRLNSLMTLEAFCYNKTRGRKKVQQRFTHVGMEEGLEEEICEEDNVEIKDSDSYKKHRYWLIQEYLEFKAAQKIQRYVRGWLVRINLAKQRWAAIVIQREWRAYYYQNWFYQKVENLLQERITEHYNKSAVKIQALYRGWWSRQNIHDHTRLVRLELNAGEDLLHCVAFKLHHLIRTYHIPGIYSLKNSTALSKVEQLLASISFKHCNDRARMGFQRDLNKFKESKAQFQKSKFATEIPFAGPNIYNICEPKCVALYSVADVDRKMIKILNMYEKATKEDPRLKTMRKSRKAKLEQHICLPPPTTFCADVVRSMKKWKIITESKYEIEPNIFKTPENVENFLKDMQSKWSILHGMCPCNKDVIQALKTQ